MSEGFWRRHHGGEGSAAGSLVRFGGVGFRIVGVMPRDFRGVETEAVDVWIPITAAPTPRR